MRIKLTTALSVTDGYGYVGQNIALALDKLGHVVWVNPIPIWHSEEQLNPRIKEMMKPFSNIDFELIIMYPTYDFGAIHKNAAIITMWEAHKCPEEWVKRLNRLKIPIFAPSMFVKQVFESSGVKSPVHHLNLGIDQETYTKNFRVYPTDIFRFLIMGKLEPRKNLATVVKAFQYTFTSFDNVELVIKTREGFLPKEFRELSKKTGQIKIIEKTVTEEELVKIYNYCHCFVYPSRGEGFAFPPRNAIANGMPTMVTDWSALAEIPGAIKIPVDKLEPMFPCGFSYGDHDNMYMATVDEEILSMMMLDITNPTNYNKFAKRAYRVKQDTWEDCAKNLVRLING